MSGVVVLVYLIVSASSEGFDLNVIEDFDLNVMYEYGEYVRRGSEKSVEDATF